MSIAFFQRLPPCSPWKRLSSGLMMARTLGSTEPSSRVRHLHRQYHWHCGMMMNRKHQKQDSEHSTSLGKRGSMIVVLSSKGVLQQQAQEGTAAQTNLPLPTPISCLLCIPALLSANPLCCTSCLQFLTASPAQHGVSILAVLSHHMSPVWCAVVLRPKQCHISITQHTPWVVVRGTAHHHPVNSSGADAECCL
jgi:hypothetical protein